MLGALRKHRVGWRSRSLRSLPRRDASVFRANLPPAPPPHPAPGAPPCFSPAVLCHPDRIPLAFFLFPFCPVSFIQLPAGEILLSFRPPCDPLPPVTLVGGGGRAADEAAFCLCLFSSPCTEPNICGDPDPHWA